MATAVVTSSEPSAIRAGRANHTVGAVVVGGDYQGLGIVRSLGRRNVPVCVLDDEYSIARFSKYTTHAVQVRRLREEREAVEQILQVGRRLGLEGWVLRIGPPRVHAAVGRPHRKSTRKVFLPLDP